MRREGVSLEDAVAGRRYRLTLMDRKPQGPSYFGVVVDYDDLYVDVEIEVMGPTRGIDARACERWPREQTLIEEMP